MFSKKSATLLAISTLLSVSNVYAAPNIGTVTGSLATGGIVQITGSGFGSTGPNIDLFDEFSGNSTSKAGDVVSLTASDAGSWSSYGTYQPTYDTNFHSPPFSMRTFANDRMQQLQKNVNSTTEAFISYWISLPQGSTFPGSTVIGSYPASGASYWKLAWIMDGPTGYQSGGTGDDICLPTYPDNTYWRLMGNNTPLNFPVGRRDTDDWFTFNGWMRLSVWLKGGAIPTVDPGSIWFQALTEGNRLKEYTGNAVLFNGGSNGIAQWTRINFPGWYGGTTATNVNLRPVYDDIYVATGPGAVARVEIGDAPDYASCKNLALLLPKSWSDGSISAEVHTGSFVANAQAYVYVFDANNVHNTVGFPVSLSGQSTSTVFSPPQNLRVISSK
ncbi:hypothetical protein [Geobacter pickeringii]|uniref:hypothetical protein n=1 Tax=Geobacter pickeringii TaxID=345632 RepID=UPI000AC6C5F5|nr:hypothetical protein [Geobacter pickeringii]